MRRHQQYDKGGQEEDYEYEHGETEEYNEGNISETQEEEEDVETEDIWDDSALIKAWDEAIADYRQAHKLGIPPSEIPPEDSADTAATAEKGKGKMDSQAQEQQGEEQQWGQHDKADHAGYHYGQYYDPRYYYHHYYYSAENPPPPPAPPAPSVSRYPGYYHPSTQYPHHPPYYQPAQSSPLPPPLPPFDGPPPGQDSSA
ncbi:hypothetical protein EV182_005032, partial [Spiromyces aspiralis]